MKRLALSSIALLMAGTALAEPPPTIAMGTPTPPVMPPGIGDFTMMSRLAGDPAGEYQPTTITDYVYVIRDEATGEEYLYFKIDGGQRIIVHREKPAVAK